MTTEQVSDGRLQAYVSPEAKGILVKEAKKKKLKLSAFLRQYLEDLAEELAKKPLE